MAMTAAEIEHFVDDLYAATGVGDWDRAADMLADDLVIVEAPGLPMEGVYRGRNALKDLYGVVMGLLDVAALERKQLTVGGDYAIAVITMRFADPSLEPAELCELFRFRDGKVCEIRPYYFDQAPIIAAARVKQV